MYLQITQICVNFLPFTLHISTSSVYVVVEQYVIKGPKDLIFLVGKLFSAI